ncbi:MAG: DUF4387 family protein [Promethearchaeota archaeon]
MALLVDLAKVIRSKNAGPFMTTIDIFFDERENYEKVKKNLIFRYKKRKEDV